MKIPLDRFEQIIDAKILEKGLSYFKDGAVTDFTSMATGEYEATVFGTEEYTVQLKVEHNTIVYHHCDCPYDMGPICKHIAAVILHLQEDALELSLSHATDPKKKKVKSVSQQVRELLRTISHEDLIEFARENIKRDKKFRNFFLASFGHLSQSQSKDFYQKQIHSILRTAAGGDDWIDWGEMMHVVRALEPFLEQAEKYLKNNNFENVFFISASLLEEMTKAFEYADDSNGELGHFIDSAMELLSKIAQEEIPDGLRQTIIEYCTSSFNREIFKGWDWHLGILEIACDLIEKENEANIIFTCLDKIHDRYEQNQVQSLRLNLMRHFADPQEVKKYIDRHISNPLIRAGELKRVFEEKDYKKVISLSKDGIKCDEKDRTGLVTDWYEWLLRAAQAQNDTGEIIEYAKFLFINNFRTEQDYYQILKDTIEDDQWQPFLEELIKEINSNNVWYCKELIRKIYIEEAYWHRLFIMLKQDPSLEHIEENEPYLSKDYSSDLVDMYGKEIINYVIKSKARRHYKTACRYLRRMKKLGGNERVNELIAFFRKQYPRRPALMDELSRV